MCLEEEVIVGDIYTQIMKSTVTRLRYSIPAHLSGLVHQLLGRHPKGDEAMQPVSLLFACIRSCVAVCNRLSLV